MSESENDKKKPKDQTDSIEDAVIIEVADVKKDDAPDEAPVPEDGVPVAESEPEASAEDDPENETDSFPDGPLETIDPREDDLTTDPEEDQTPNEEQPELEPEKVVTPTQQPEVTRQGGFVPMVLGGVVAAALGFGASQFLYPNGMGGADQSQAIDELTATVQQQGATIARMGKELEAVQALPTTADVPALETLAALVDDANGAIAKVSSRVTTLETRLTELEKQPVGSGPSADTVAAYEREVEAMRAALQKQKTEIEELVNAAQQEKASAELTVKQAMIRSAISRIQVALDTGKGFSGAVADLKAGGVTVPAILVDAADTGVPSVAALSEVFPAAARSALSAARKEEGSGGKALTFLRNQLGVRSLEPKEGNDPDAILSRAEAALNDGRLGDAMAELQDLPELARIELTDWMALAARRADAVAATETLGATVASN